MPRTAHQKTERVRERASEAEIEPRYSPASVGLSASFLPSFLRRHRRFLGSENKSFRPLVESEQSDWRPPLERKEGRKRRNSEDAVVNANSRPLGVRRHPLRVVLPSRG